MATEIPAPRASVRPVANNFDTYTEETAGYQWQKLLYPLRKRVDREQRIRIRVALVVWWQRRYKKLPTRGQLEYMFPLEVARRGSNQSV